MLLSFRVENFKSMRYEQQLLLTPTYPDDQVDNPDWDAVPVAGIFGANASGKTNVLQALAFMRDLIRGSLRDSEAALGIVRYPFALDDAARLEPSTFVVDLLLRGVRYTYGFSIDDSRVVEEWLHGYPHRRKREIFHRSVENMDWSQKTSASIRKYVEDIEPNVLVLSVVGRFRVEEVKDVFSWFMELMFKSPSMARISRWDRQGYGPPRLGEEVSALLRAADTGIDSAEMVEESEEEWAERISRVGPQSDTSRRKYMRLRHRGEDGATFPLSIREQSLGTRELLDLGSIALTALRRGSVLMVDEIDRSLHTFLTAQIIKLFTNPETNPRGAQLIFSSHDFTLLGRVQGVEVLNRDHIWFTEKDECGATELFPISAFKPRREENRERRYLAGRYGAVPIVKDELFAAALSAREESVDAESKG